MSQEFPYRSDCIPYQIKLPPGKYFIEAWGASGGGIDPGLGAYAAGSIIFHSKTILYAIVAGKGEDGALRKFIASGGCGGGGNGGMSYSDAYSSGSGGGGATTIFILNQSIENRILVSAGGGGRKYGTPGNAGGLIGEDALQP